MNEPRIFHIIINDNSWFIRGRSALPLATKGTQELYVKRKGNELS